MSVLISYWDRGSKQLIEPLMEASVSILSKKNKVNLVRDKDYDLPSDIWPIAKIKTHIEAAESIQIDCDVLWDYPADLVDALAREFYIDAIYQRRESIHGNTVYKGQSMPPNAVAFNAGFTYLSPKAKEVLEGKLKASNFNSFEEASTFEQIWVPRFLYEAGLKVATLEDLIPMLQPSAEKSIKWAKRMYSSFTWQQLFALKCWIHPINYLHLVGDIKHDFDLNTIIADYIAP